LKIAQAQQGAASGGGDTSALSAALTAAEQRAQAAEQRLGEVLIHDGLQSALASAGVAPAMLPAASALLRERGAEIQNGEAVLNGRPLADAVKDWAQSEEAMHFKAAASNSGGGTPPSRQDMTGGEANPFTRSNWNLTAQTMLRKSNPAKAASMARAAGVDPDRPWSRGPKR
jgi:hypothetical protein